jgi:biotin synthase
MGESVSDLLDVAYDLNELGSESIPVNFLVPIPGNDVIEPVCGGVPLSPTFCLRLLCVMRLINPRAEIRMAAGREIHLRSLQAMALEPANSLFIEGYLLTQGTNAIDTVRMIRDAGFEIDLSAGEASEELRAIIDAMDSTVTEPDLNVIKDAHISERKLAKLSVSAKQ